jgi:glucose-1-phosphate thymidylyltransferase
MAVVLSIKIPMHAFILAGGFATRLWPLTEKRAKPLLPLAGKPLLTHLLEKIPRDIPVTVSTNAAFADGFSAWQKMIDRPTDLIIEGTKSDDHKLGALGALSAWITQQKIDDDILLLTGDNYLGFSMDAFLKLFQGNPLLAAHDIGDTIRASQFGTVILENGTELKRTVKGFEEKPKEPKTTLVSTGCSILPKSTLPILLAYAEQKPDNVGGIFEEFLARGMQVDCFTFTEPWIDIGSFASYLDAHRTLMKGTTLIPSNSKTVDVTMQGSVVIGHNCTIERSTLRDCMVFDGCTIEDCTLENCIVDEQCILKGIDIQNQMLRAGTKLVVEE